MPEGYWPAISTNSCDLVLLNHVSALAVSTGSYAVHGNLALVMVLFIRTFV